MSFPTFLAIGHVVKDVVGEGYRLGGGAAYAAVTAARLGEQAAVVTRAIAEDISELEKEVSLHIVPATKTTIFRNSYQGSTRLQQVLAVAEPLTLEHVPQAWRKAQVVLLAPVAQEVDPGLARAFPRALVGASLQGWLRQWDDRGHVRFHPWAEAPLVLPQITVAVLSEKDVRGDERLLETYAQMVEVLAVTQGVRGARVHHRGQWTASSAFPAVERNPTGAGDAFAAAFLIAWHQTRDVTQAARFANATASLAVEGTGLFQLPTRDQVEDRLRGKT